jgi:hypothetical protein
VQLNRHGRSVARFRRTKFIAAREKMSSPFETRVAGIVVYYFDGSGYVTQDLTLTSDTQLIRIGGMVSGFFWMGK